MSQDYKMVRRKIVVGATQLDEAGNLLVQNANEFQDYLNEVYLRNGYVVNTVNAQEPSPAEISAGANWVEYTYHLTKNL